MAKYSAHGRRSALMLVFLIVCAIAAVALATISRLTGLPGLDGTKWVWHMLNKDEYGLIGEHLEPGREYYFEVHAATFVKNYPQHAPVSAEQVEPQDTVIISKVRQDQKNDEDIVYVRKREAYSEALDPSDLGLTVNGVYFFSITEQGHVEHRISIDHALRMPRYLKFHLYLQKIKEAELVTRVSEGHNKYSYWKTTGNLKENIGYRIENGRRKDWRECYAESDGDHAPCSGARENSQ